MIVQAELNTKPLVLEDRIRGVPPGSGALPASSVSDQDWHRAEGVTALPVLALDESVFAADRDLMLAYAREGLDQALCRRPELHSCPYAEGARGPGEDALRSSG
jgi:hypothetical protein